MASIRLISSSFIKSGSPKNEIERIQLTPWDLQHLLVGYIQSGLLFHIPKQQEEEPKNGLIQRLKDSLSRTLDFFVPLAGRLATVDHEDETTSFFIDCNNAGALFVHAVAEKVTISDLIEPVYIPDIFDSFFQFDEVKNIEGISKPLLAVQVTELEEAIFIACSINHSVVDGASFWHFFDSWSEISRGNSVHLSKIPIFERQFLNGIDNPIRIPRKQVQDHINDELIETLLARHFYFTKHDIQKIKTKANVEMNTDKISSLQAVLSHFWRSIMRNRHLEPNQDTIILIVVGFRQKLQQLPEEYFGNAVQSTMVTLKTGDLIEKGLGTAAMQINKIVANYHPEEDLMTYLECWANNPRIYQTRKLMDNALLIAGSPRLDTYGIDFGWGKPIAVRHGAGFKFDGVLTVYGGVEEGSFEIKVCLSPEILQALEKDHQDFISALTSTQE
ncbi:Transferase [Corchorus olitorius]|uniref:Transferase n=1 Tax=Corchorus olitorius TaxID=93759 RepID=A0A1R3K4F4_9ROSI|nr:Transferase [Corchorus olitorius]